MSSQHASSPTSKLASNPSGNATSEQNERHRAARVKVVVVDRNQLFTDCLALVLEMRQYDLEKVTLPVGHAHTEAVLARALSARPRVAVIDADLGPRCNAIELTGVLAERGVAVVVVTDRVDEAQWGHCLAAGARIVVPRSASLATMMSAIRRLSHGQRVLHVTERERLVSLYRQRRAHRHESLDRLNLLSANEGEVLAHLMAGRSVREIAARRVVSEATVRTQVKSILSKLQVGSQLSAVAVAHAAGWGTAAVAAAG